MNDIKGLSEKFSDLLPQLKRYLPYLFGLLILVLYGYLLYRVNVLNTAEPSVSDVTAQSQTASVPKVDPNLVKQLQSLQDNSSSVKAAFQDARDNPFQE